MFIEALGLGRDKGNRPGLVFVLYERGDSMLMAGLFSSSSASSWGRFGSFLALLAVIVWVSWVVFKTNVIPDLVGPTVFISGLYALGKINETVQNGQPNGQSKGISDINLIGKEGQNGPA